MKPLIVCLLLLAGASPTKALAQSLWRCGPDGRSYTDTPCADGRALATPEPRPAADIASAREVARRESSLAAQQLRDREQREAAVPGGAIGIRGTRLAAATQPVKPSAKAPKHPSRQAKPRPEDADTWRATAPSSRRTKG